MKRKLVCVLLMVTIIAVGCGKKEEASVVVEESTKKESSTVISEDISSEKGDAVKEKNQTQETVDVEGNSMAIYPDAESLSAIEMGVSDPVCTVKMPVNYMIVASGYDDNGNLSSLDGTDASSMEVQDAVGKGVFSAEKSMASFTLTSLGENTVIMSATMHPVDKLSVDAVKDAYSNAKEIGDGSIPAVMYQGEGMSGENVVVVMQINNEATLMMAYEGDVLKSLNADQVATQLYEIVTTK